MKITYVSSKGERQTVDTSIDGSLMDVALANGVEEIDAECGGGCCCGSCRVYVAEAWRERLPPPDQYEGDMLDAIDDDQDGVRLSCRIPVAKAIDGIVVHTPSSQR